MFFIVPDDSPPKNAGVDATDAGTSLDAPLDIDDAAADADAPAAVGKVELDLDDAPFLVEEEEPEPEPAPEAAAEPAVPDEAAEPAAKKRDFKALLKALLKDKRVLAGAGSAVILLAVGAYFLFGSSEPDAAPPPEATVAPTEAEAPKEPAKPAEYYIRWEPFWVEFNDKDGNTRFLICRFAGVTLNEIVKHEAEAKQTALRDTIYYYLVHKDKTFLGNTANADALKRDVLAVVNQYLSSGQLDQILLEDYVIK